MLKRNFMALALQRKPSASNDLCGEVGRVIETLTWYSPNLSLNGIQAQARSSLGLPFHLV
jgi:hypothetical protein